MVMNKTYSYRNSIKSVKSDELINTYLLRPIAGIIVRVIYSTPITPNQITILSIASGIAAALFYAKGTADAFVTAGLLVTLKDILDSADGQLARAKQQYSRAGRFLDSLGDFVVNVAVFGSIGWTLYTMNGDWFMLFLAFFGLAGISLRVSYHVFYQVHFLHLQNQYENNRSTEEIRMEDLSQGGIELMLQYAFQFIYGWQDRMMVRINEWSMGPHGRLSENGQREPSESERAWYSNTLALRISGLLGFGTELFLLTVCSVFNKLKLYLYLNLFLMNGILFLSIALRRYVVSARCFNEKMSDG
jgi:phosphatidylglycerophosphate synthase